jgi:hypothetical protein
MRGASDRWEAQRAIARNVCGFMRFRRPNVKGAAGSKIYQWFSGPPNPVPGSPSCQIYQLKQKGLEFRLNFVIRHSHGLMILETHSIGKDLRQATDALTAL